MTSLALLDYAKAPLADALRGDPNGERLPTWPAYDAETDRWLDVGATTEVRSGVLRDKLDLLERRYRDRLAD